MSGRPRIALRVHGGLSAKECAAQARAAEEAGFSTVWFAENAFARGAMSGLAASALATSSIRLGVGVFNPFNRHPTLIAMEMAALDELSDGRVVLGIGSGIRLGQIGIAAPRRIAAVRNAIYIVSRLLRGETVEYEGPVFSARGVRLECPLRRAALPICMAAMGDQALDLCGRIADGLMISNLSPPAFTRRAVGIVARGAAAAGKPMPAEIGQYVTGPIDDERHRRRPARGRSARRPRPRRQRHRQPLHYAETRHSRMDGPPSGGTSPRAVRRRDLLRASRPVAARQGARRR